VALIPRVFVACAAVLWFTSCYRATLSAHPTNAFSVPDGSPFPMEVRVRPPPLRKTRVHVRAPGHREMILVVPWRLLSVFGRSRHVELYLVRDPGPGIEGS
jgi:hypothetical protein